MPTTNGVFVYECEGSLVKDTSGILHNIMLQKSNTYHLLLFLHYMCGIDANPTVCAVHPLRCDTAQRKSGTPYV